MIAGQDFSMLTLVPRGCAVSHKKLYQCYVPIFMVLNTINYFLLASDSVINYLTARNKNFITKLPFSRYLLFPCDA